MLPPVEVAMAIDQNLDRTSELKKHAHELVKQYLVYDGANRVTDVYTARTDAVNGEVCEHTQYTYVGATPLVEKRKENISTWNSSWDI